MAMSGLNKVLSKAGVNIYRVGTVAGIGEAGRAIENQQQQAQQPEMIEIPEFSE
jgi:hypothetical protein